MNHTSHIGGRSGWPILHETRHDRVSAGMISIVVGLTGIVTFLLIVWLGSRQTSVTRTISTVEFLEMESPAGAAVTGELPIRLELPDQSPPVEIAVESDPGQQSLMVDAENLVELCDPLASNVEQTLSAETGESSPSGVSTVGPMGIENQDKLGVIPAEQRWLIKFEDSSLAAYAAQLDYFGIELGALFPERGELVFLSNLSGSKPTSRVTTIGGDNRLYMVWRGGKLRTADLALFRKSGQDPTGATLMHFYSPETEQLLTQVEASYRGRKTSDIRRTYFSVRRDGAGFKFVVISQSYLR